jgi:hypothetical protein
VTAARREIGRDIAESFSGDAHFDGDDRFQERGSRLLERLAECGGRSRFKCLFRAVDRVVLSEEDFYLNVDNLVTLDDPFLQLLA